MASKKKLVPQENALMMFNRFLQMAEDDEQKTLILDMKQAFLELPTKEIIHTHGGLKVYGDNRYRICTNCKMIYEEKNLPPTQRRNFCMICGAKLNAESRKEIG